MPGFFVSNHSVPVTLHNFTLNPCLMEEIPTGGGYTFIRNTLDKFLADKAFSKTDELVIVHEGCVLNKTALLADYHADSMDSLIQKMYSSCGETFFQAFEGSFSGAVYDIKCNKWVVYVSRMGDTAVFYALQNGGFYAGSQVNYVVDALKMHGVSLSFDEQAAYEMLTCAFMRETRTYANEIKRLRGGTYLCVENGMAEIKEYHRFAKHPERFRGWNEDDLIDAVDQSFRQAVRLEWGKDDEYGLRHLSDLSGGLDSRMNIWVAHNLGDIHVQLLDVCRQYYLDEKISRQIALYWKDEILLKPLDDCSFLYEIDELTGMTNGLSLYAGITGVKRLLESVNAKIYGFEHTGQLGDVVLGSYCSSENDNSLKYYSFRLDHRLAELDESVYGDHELYLLYSRGFQGILNTHSVRNNYTEVSSPFLNTDFFQLCMDIPIDIRANHKLYKKWILSKYPEAAKFKWEAINGYLTQSRVSLFLHKCITRGPSKILEMMKPNLSSWGMNPLNYWLAHNPQVAEFLSEYEQAHYEYLPAGVSNQLKEDMHDLFLTGNTLEKTMVLTVLSAAKLYFGDENDRKLSPVHGEKILP